MCGASLTVPSLSSLTYTATKRSMERMKGRLAELIAANCPVFHLHPQDNFMPTSVEHFMHHSELIQQEVPSDDVSQWTTRLTRGQVTSATLAAAQHRFRGQGSMRLLLCESARCGFPKDLIDDVPLYVNVKEVISREGQVEALEFNYLTFYAYNGPYSVFGVAVGAHAGDWEHVTVRVDAETGRTVGMYYHAHRNHDGVWLPARVMPRDKQGSGRPAAYVAYHGHGCYPTPGRQLRALLVANDLCAGDGPLWRPRRCIVLPYLADRPPPPSYLPQRQPGSLMIMRVPSRGTTLPATADDVAPGRDTVSNLVDSEVRLVSVSLPDDTVAGSTSSLYPERTTTSPTLEESPVLERSTALEHSTQTSHKRLAVSSDCSCSEANCMAHHSSLLPAGMAHPSAIDSVSIQSCTFSREGANGAASSQEPLEATERSTGRDTLQLLDAMQRLQVGGGHSADVEVVQDSAEWLLFEGQWGETPAPITQKWFRSAEPPVSRTLLRRILHFPSEAVLPPGLL